MEKSIYSPEYAIALRVLRLARERAGLTQVELAKRLGQTQSFVTKVERGDRRLDIVQLRTICRELGLTLAEFVRRWGSGDSPRPSDAPDRQHARTAAAGGGARRQDLLEVSARTVDEVRGYAFDLVALHFFEAPQPKGRVTLRRPVVP